MSLPPMEWSLISGRSDGSATDVVSQVVHAKIVEVLRSSAAKVWLKPFASAAGRALSQDKSMDWPQLSVPPSESGIEGLAIAVACLHAFVQLNWTGPELDAAVHPAALLRSVDPDTFPPRKVDNDSAGPSTAASSDVPAGDESLHGLLHVSAVEALSLDGEPAYHLCRAPALLLIAVRIFDTLSEAKELDTVAWWRLRAGTVHRHLLDEAVAYPVKFLATVDTLTLTLEERSSSESKAPSRPWTELHARILLERGLAMSRVGADKQAADIFVRAAEAHGLQYEMTGALGKRTKFQKVEKAQLVVLAESAPWARGDASAEDSVKAEIEEDASEQEAAADATIPTTLALNDDTLLEQTKFTSTARASNRSDSHSPLSHIEPSSQPALNALDQCTLLALCLNISNSSPANGLVASQMGAFVSRVISHPVNWSVHTVALLLRSRLEASRTRTAERAALQLQALLDQIPATTESDAPADVRLQYFHALALPARWELQAEVAKLYAALGAVRSALEIYERVEMWEEVVQCLGAMGRSAEGAELVRDLLEGRKREVSAEVSQRKRGDAAPDTRTRKRIDSARRGKLWCLLGDLQAEEAEHHYLAGWRESGQSSGRAARSLGAVYFARAEIDKSIQWLRSALRLNPLFTRTWFLLGCALMRSSEIAAGQSAGGVATREDDLRWEEAAQAFARCTALDEDDGESWNNLASCYLRMGRRAAARLDASGVDAWDSAEHGARVLLEEEDEESDTDDSASSTTTERAVSEADSGVEVSSASSATPSETDEIDDFAANEQTSRPGATPYSLLLRAHGALKRATKLSHDSWRVWTNYMVVSVDVGLLGEASRALRRTVEIRAQELSVSSTSSAPGSLETKLEQTVDLDVLDRLVSAVVRAPSKQEDAVEVPPQTEAAADGFSSMGAVSVSAPGPSPDPTSIPQAQHSPHEGHGLFPSVESLITTTLLTRLHSSPRIWRAHARLLLWRGAHRAALEAHLAAYRCGAAARVLEGPAEGSAEAQTQKEREKLFKEAVSEVEELCEMLENLGPRQAGVGKEIAAGAGSESALEAIAEDAEGQAAEEEQAMPDWKFRARSLVRTFLARTKDEFGELPEWEMLVELRDSYRGNAGQ